MDYISANADQPQKLNGIFKSIFNSQSLHTKARCVHFCCVIAVSTDSPHIVPQLAHSNFSPQSTILSEILCLVRIYPGPDTPRDATFVPH
ncbi:hypothetical protein V496_05358 [Pseudogymnoascus sp. VKM F-4515 (FW-2607)]|nr:hypothetical protein V496_05358 [Pseudogymnoascus sp. VKM F-4515 (FW-2607)]